jgi:hypothetical protein
VYPPEFQQGRERMGIVARQLAAGEPSHPPESGRSLGGPAPSGARRSSYQSRSTP